MALLQLPLLLMLLLLLLLLVLSLASTAAGVHVQLLSLQTSLKGVCQYPISDSFTTLDCSSPALDAVPTVERSLQLSAFVQRGSPISSIPAFAFANSSDTLRLLSVSSSARLRSVHPQSLRNLTQLRSVSLVSEQPQVNSSVDLRQLLVGLRSLNSLTLRNLRVGRLVANFAADCPKLQTVRLLNCFILAIDADALPASLSSLEFADNSPLPLQWAQAAGQLRNLTLRQCGLSTFRPPAALSSLLLLAISDSSLSLLDLSLLRNASILRLQADSSDLDSESLPGLEQLVRLQELGLAGNLRLRQLPRAVAQLPQLLHLDVRGSNLVAVRAGDFHADSQLRSLRLDHSPVDLVEAAAFGRVRQLQRLSVIAADPKSRSLKQLVVESVTDLRPLGWATALRRLPLLQTLTLAGSADVNGGLDDAVWPALAECTRLQHLRLDHNAITAIPDFLLSSLPSLRSLSLAGNDIRSVSSAAFYAAGHLQVDLSSNRIATLTSCSLGMFASARSVRLSGNPLVCDCSLLWLLRRLRREVADGESSDADLRCHQPARLRDADWRDLGDADFCDSGAGFSGDADCRVLTPSVPTTTTTPFPWSLDLRLSRQGDAAVLLEVAAAQQLRRRFSALAVRYAPADAFADEAAVKVVEAPIDTQRLRLAVGSADVAYQFCVLLVASDAEPVAHDANCRQLAPAERPLPASTLFAIVAASCGAVLLLLLLPLLFCCLRRRRLQRKEEQKQQQQQQQRRQQQRQEQYYTYLDAEDKGNPRFQAARKPESRRFTRRSVGNLAGSRPSLAGSATTLTARQSGEFAQPLQPQPPQQQQQQFSSLSRVAAGGLRHSQSAQLVLDDPYAQYQQLQYQQQQLLQHLLQQQQQQQQQQMLLARSTEQLAHSTRLQRHCRSQENVLSPWQQDAQEETPPPLPARHPSTRSFGRLVDPEAEDTYEEMQT